MKTNWVWAALACAMVWGAPASAQNLSLRAPPWAAPLLTTDVIATTGGRAAIAAEGLTLAVRVTIAPLQGGVARVIRYELRDDGATISLRRFTGHPSTGWWLWGSDYPQVSPAPEAARSELATMVRAAMGVNAINAPESGATCRGEQAFVEMHADNRSASASRACVVATDPIGRLALRLSELAGSQTEADLAAAAVEEVLAVDRAFAAMAATEGVPEAFEHFAANDAIMLRSEGAPTEGRAAVAARFAQWPEGARLEWAPALARVSTRGDMAWSWGNSVYVAPDGTRDEGRYISVWTRGDDGGWRFAFDAGVE